MLFPFPVIFFQLLPQVLPGPVQEAFHRGDAGVHDAPISLLLRPSSLWSTKAAFWLSGNLPMAWKRSCERSLLASSTPGWWKSGGSTNNSWFSPKMLITFPTFSSASFCGGSPALGDRDPVQPGGYFSFAFECPDRLKHLHEHFLRYVFRVGRVLQYAQRGVVHHALPLLHQLPESRFAALLQICDVVRQLAVL